MVRSTYNSSKIPFLHFFFDPFNFHLNPPPPQLSHFSKNNNVPYCTTGNTYKMDLTTALNALAKMIDHDHVKAYHRLCHLVMPVCSTIATHEHTSGGNSNHQMVIKTKNTYEYNVENDDEDKDSTNYHPREIFVVKHLCGSALDIALKCVNDFVHRHDHLHLLVKVIFSSCFRALCSWPYFRLCASAWKASQNDRRQVT